MTRLRVLLAPAMVDPAELSGQVVLVVDLLRASTTITAALAAGAAMVVPCQEPQDALAVARSLAPDPVILGGERGGLPIEGFHLGNGPQEYTRPLVAGRVIAFTTTNGTRSIHQARGAAHLLVACLNNASSAARLAATLARETSASIHILCAGIHGRIASEDVLAAGAIVERLRPMGVDDSDDDASLLAALAWERASRSPDHLDAALRASRGGRNMKRIGLDGQIPWCARVDTTPIVPVRTGLGELVARRVDAI